MCSSPVVTSDKWMENPSYAMDCHWNERSLGSDQIDSYYSVHISASDNMSFIRNELHFLVIVCAETGYNDTIYFILSLFLESTWTKYFYFSFDDFLTSKMYCKLLVLYSYGLKLLISVLTLQLMRECTLGSLDSSGGNMPTHMIW